MNKLLSIFFIFFATISIAQPCYFTGWVKDSANNENIIDAFVVEEGTSNYQLTSNQGYFSLKLQAQKEIYKFVITAIGYKPLVVN